MLRTGAILLAFFSLIFAGFAEPCALQSDVPACSCGPLDCCFKNAPDAQTPLNFAPAQSTPAPKLISLGQASPLHHPPCVASFSYSREKLLSRASLPDTQARLAVFVI